MQSFGILWHEPSSVLDGDTVRWMLIGVALLALFALRHVSRPRGRSRAYRWRPRFRRSSPVRNVAQPTSSAPARAEPEFDSAAQMRAIAPFDFETEPLLNQSEAPLLYLLERVAGEVGGGFRVMAQTSLGEIIRPRPARGSSGEIAQAYRAINSKRLDLAIFNKFGKLVIGVEYQGHGHYRQTAFMRDAIKREVLRRAGVPMLEVPAEYEATKVEAEVREILSAHRALLRPTESAAPRTAGERRPATA